MEVKVPFKELPLWEAFTFDYRLGGKLLDAFIIRHEQGYSCFQNMCAHIPVALDYDDGDFFSDKIGRIVCKTHGATFRAEDGYCDGGPCAGQKLNQFDMTIEPSHDTDKEPEFFIVQIPD